MIVFADAISHAVPLGVFNAIPNAVLKVFVEAIPYVVLKGRPPIAQGFNPGTWF